MSKNRDQGIPVKTFSKNFRELLKELFSAHSVVGSFLVNLHYKHKLNNFHIKLKDYV